MSWSFPIGRLLGSELRVHVTFFLILIWIGVAGYTDGGWPTAIESLALIVAIFACVIAHEYGHALMARRFGIRTPDITLLPIGGLARLERMPEKPAQEIAVALAGPAVNIAIWAVLIVVFRADTSIDNLSTIDDPGHGFWARIAVINLFLAAFNLIPAFPMDGGRVLRALLATRFSRTRATRIAATTGQALAFVFGFLGLLGGNPFLIFIGVFVYFAASAESSHVAINAVARRMSASQGMITAFERLGPGATLQDAADALIKTTQHEFPVVDNGGHLTGFLTRAALFTGLAQEGGRALPVDTIMTRDVPVVRAHDRLDKALAAMTQARAPAVGVVDGTGRLIGYITTENIGELMMIDGQAN